MKIISTEATSYSTGRVLVTFDSGQNLSLELTPEENERILQIGRDIFASRQKAVAKEIAEAQPFAMIELQPAVSEHNYDEIPF